MLKKNTIILLLTTFWTGLSAQVTNDFRERFEQANEAYVGGAYYAALPLFLELYQTDTTNRNLSYLVACCYINGRSQRVQAVPYLHAALRSVDANYKAGSPEERMAPLSAYKELGDIYHINSRFDTATYYYETYLKELQKHGKRDDVNYKDAQRKIQMCIVAKKLVADPVNIKIENMGANLNSMYGDYSPVITADQETLIFTSRRKESTGGKTYDGGRYFEDIYISRRNGAEWAKVSNIGSPINTNGNEAAVGISPDGQQILIYKDDKGDGNIYSTTLDGDTWTEPVKLPAIINSKHWEPSASMSADGHYIYFTSDRPGGYGGRDIYVSEKNDKGEWAKAVNMGALVNSEFDEDAPYIHPDGVTLFYSSNGHRTMGGFDIFYTVLKDNLWQAPANVGFPVNSPDDDIYFVVSPDKTKAYYSSFKEGGFGEKDNFMITFLDQKKAPLTIVKGIVIVEDGSVPLGVEITVTDNVTGKEIGVYKPNKLTGKYLFILVPGRNYNISYEAEGYLFYSENRVIAEKTNYFEEQQTVQLPLITVGAKVVLNNIFFDFDKATLRPLSNVELARINKFMAKYPKVVIEIAGHTDSKGEAYYNLKLSKERSVAVVNYLLAKGIAKHRLKARGYGETEPAQPNSDKDGKDDEEARQMNRRVEMKIIEIK